MYNITDIQHLHLEISSRCNAACPLCPRNFYGYSFNDGYVEHDMSLKEAQKIFSKVFLNQLNEIYINGNFGDIVMNKHSVDILKYFKSSNPALKIIVSTNGGARNKKFWTDLAELDIDVVFCLDGLEDTHHLYRQNTKFKTVIKNANYFIESGGHATWKMIKFDHNIHQISMAEKESKRLGFKKFILVDHGRHTGPVFNQQKQLTHVIGKPKITDFETLFKSRSTDTVLLEDIVHDRTPYPISCQVKKQKSIYVSSTGDVYPCCFLAFSPKTYGHGNYHQAANAQFNKLINKNNALTYPLHECINWFYKIEETWQIPDFDQGRLVICNDVCGQRNK